MVGKFRDGVQNEEIRSKIRLNEIRCDDAAGSFCADCDFTPQLASVSNVDSLGKNALSGMRILVRLPHREFKRGRDLKLGDEVGFGSIGIDLEEI